MKKLALLIFSMVLLCAVASNTYAFMFTFSGSDNGGTGSATMDISVNDNIVTAVLNNTSPITLDTESGVNAPGITAFGFDLDPDGLILDSWSLTAYLNSGSNSNSELIDIESWNLTIDGNTNGIKVDYVPNTDNGILGALYNPAVESGEAATPNFYTEAILTMVFRETPYLNFTDLDSPIVRMQNVGTGGEGSLKLPGAPVPEPSTILLIGTGILCMITFGRKRLNKKA